MSYSRKEGKDEIIFVTEEDHEKAIAKDDYDDEQEGLINEDGTINWDCPCLGGMASGPCGVEFRESFTCFHYSKEEPKGSDCLEPFRTLHDCMTKYPDYYGRKTGSRSSGDEDDDEEEDNDSEQKTGNKSEESSSDKSLQSGVTKSAEAKEGKSL